MEEKIGNRVAIQKLHSKGFTQKKISEILGLNLNKVSKWVKRISVKDLKRTGRPSKISTRIAKLIEKVSMNKWTDQGASTRSISKLLKRQGNDISHMSVQLF